MKPSPPAAVVSGLTSGVPFLDGFQLGESRRASVPGPTQALPGNQSAGGCGQEAVEKMECFMVLSGGQQLAVALLALTLGACALLENLLVLCVILRSRALRRRPSYLFMGSLAAADLLGGVIFVYSFLDFHVLQRKDSPPVFLFKLAGVIASFSASVGGLFLTAVDRFLSVQRPLAYRRRLTRRRALLAFALMWSVSVAVSLLPLLGWNCERLKSVCSHIFPLIDRTYLMLWVGTTVLLLLFVVYAYVFILWKSHRRAVRTLSSRRSAAAAARPEQARLDLRLAKTLVLILAALVVCWGPLLAIMAYDLFGKVDDFVKTLFAFCSMLCLLNSAANPIIYAMRSKELRRAFLGRHTPDCSGQSNSRSVRSAGKDGRGKAQVKVAQASVCGPSQASSVEAL